jgi:hypothetical protein
VSVSPSECKGHTHTPVWIGQHGLDHTAACNAGIQRVAVCLHRERRLGAGQTTAVQDPRRLGCGQVRVDARELDVGGKVLVVGDGLLLGQVRELVDRAGVERVALAVEAVLEDDAEAVGRLHQDLDDARLQVGEAALDRRLAADVQEDWSAGLIVGVIEDVALLKGVLGVRFIARVVREVVNLEAICSVEVYGGSIGTYRLIDGVRSVAGRPPGLAAMERFRRRPLLEAPERSGGSGQAEQGRKEGEQLHRVSLDSMAARLKPQGWRVGKLQRRRPSYIQPERELLECYLQLTVRRAYSRVCCYRIYALRPALKPPITILGR